MYILDEVHMLSKGAAGGAAEDARGAAADTSCSCWRRRTRRRSSETISSRARSTCSFHLLPADVAGRAGTSRWVVAGRGAGPSARGGHRLRALAGGAGSARDTLSTLELIANAGGDSGDALSFDELVEALIDHDAGRALTAMASAVNAGHEPRPLAEALVRHLPRRLPVADGARPGAALRRTRSPRSPPRPSGSALPALVRAIERLGEILVELRSTPGPRVLVEVALVQLATVPAAGAAPATTSARWPPVSPTSNRPSPSGRPAAGRRPRPRPGDRPDRRQQSPARRIDRSSPTTAAATTTPPAAAAPPPADIDLDGLRREWSEQVRPTLKGLVRALFGPVDVIAASGPTVTMAAPNEMHHDKCQQHQASVQEAWLAATGRAVIVELAVDGDATGEGVVARPAAGPPPDEHVDLDDLVDAAPGTVPTTLDRLAQAFPGAELIERRD